jgi:TRAP-type transport system periplasmic protein
MIDRRALLAGCCAMLAGCGGTPLPPGTTVLTYATPYPPTHPFSRADRTWMDHVAQASGGRLRIRPYWSGALLSSDQSMVEIRHGVADIGLITPIYARGGAHALRIQSGFYGGVRTMDDQVAVYKCLADRFPVFNRELEGLHVLAVQGGNFPGIATRDRVIRSLADLRGLRLRAPSENLEMLRELGADPVNMPMGEVYPALAKRVIDGVVAPADTLRSLHFAEVAPHFTTIRFSRGAYPARAISQRSWDRLPPDLQAVLTAGQPVWERALRDELARAEADGFAFGRSHNVTFASISEAEQRRFVAVEQRNAERGAIALRAFGTDGIPIFREAQRLIGLAQPGCAPGATS